MSEFEQIFAVFCLNLFIYYFFNFNEIGRREHGESVFCPRTYMHLQCKGNVIDYPRIPFGRCSKRRKSGLDSESAREKRKRRENKSKEWAGSLPIPHTWRPVHEAHFSSTSATLILSRAARGFVLTPVCRTNHLLCLSAHHTPPPHRSRVPRRRADHIFFFLDNRSSRPWL
jgi:hypothetical protein